MSCSITTGRPSLGAGGPDLDRDDSRDRYRMGALYAYVAPLITAGRAACRPSDRHGRPEAGVAALEDLEMVALLERSR